MSANIWIYHFLRRRMSPWKDGRGFLAKPETNSWAGNGKEDDTPQLHHCSGSNERTSGRHHWKSSSTTNYVKTYERTKYAHSLTLWSLRLPALITGRGSLLHGLLLGWEMMCAKIIFTNKYNAELSLIKHVNGPKLNQFNVLEGHIRVLMIITKI